MPMIVTCKCPICKTQWNAEHSDRGLLVPGWFKCPDCRAVVSENGEFMGEQKPDAHPGNDVPTGSTMKEGNDV